MIEKQFLSDQRIVECLNAEYGIIVAELILIPLGADMDAVLYKAHTSHDQSYFIKLKRGYHHNVSPTIQLLLHDSGIKNIISPIKTKHGQATLRVDDSTLIVYPFIEGKNGFEGVLSDDQWITLGRILKQVHGFCVPPLIRDQIKRESYPSQWREAVRSIYTHIDAEQRVTDQSALKLLTFMKEHRAKIQRLVDRAEQLAQKIKQQTHEFVLCHADIHGGNVLIANDGSIYIVDWDQLIMAPKERDLMFIGGGVANVWNNQHEEELFYRGYGKAEINRNILAYYRHERIVEDIALYSQQLFLKTDGSQDREIMYKQFVDMFEPWGVVDIAFKTDSGL